MIPWREKLALKPAEVAAILSVSRRTVYRLIAAGGLKSQKIGRAVVVPTEDLIRFMTGAELPPALTPRAASVLERFRDRADRDSRRSDRGDGSR